MACPRKSLWRELDHRRLSSRYVVIGAPRRATTSAWIGSRAKTHAGRARLDAAVGPVEHAPLATNRRSKRMPEAPPQPPPAPPREGDHPVNRRSTTPSSPRDSLPPHRASHERADPPPPPSSGRRTSTTAASRSPPPPPPLADYHAADRAPLRRRRRRVPPLRAGIFFLVSADSTAGDAAVVDLLWLHHLPPPWSSASGSWDLSHSVTL